MIRFEMSEEVIIIFPGSNTIRRGKVCGINISSVNESPLYRVKILYGIKLGDSGIVLSAIDGLQSCKYKIPLWRIYKLEETE